MGLARRSWKRWKAAVFQIGHVQTMILLAIIYFVAIGGIAVAGRIIGQDLLGLRRSKGGSYWNSLSDVTTSVERAQQQF